jgi:hypothetical protein
MDSLAVRGCVRTLLSRAEPALLVPRGPWNAALEQEIQRLDPGKDSASLAVISGLRLWNDDLDGCHKIAQELSDDFGAHLHGIMHRREPDYGNSKYWFRRVGEPPLFPQLRTAALELLGRAQGLDSYAKALQSHPKWDPFRMVDWCESAGEEREVSFLRALQAIEIQGLTYFWLDRAGLSRP